MKGAAVILFRYNPEGEETYYTYELADMEPGTATASNAVATPDVAYSTIKASGNAWLTGGTDVTAAGTTKIRVTGTVVRKGTWEPCSDLDGVSVRYTDEDGHYQFRVPIADMSPDSAMNQVYRYRVQVYQPDGVETWKWTGQTIIFVRTIRWNVCFGGRYLWNMLHLVSFTIKGVISAAFSIS